MRSRIPDDRNERHGLYADARGDFDDEVVSAEAEADAAQLDSTLAQIIGVNHQVLAGFRRLEAQLAERAWEETRHVAALSKIVIAPHDVTSAAYNGAVAGVQQQHATAIRQVADTARKVEAVAGRLVENAKVERVERRLWVDAIMYAACAAAVAITVAGAAGYIVGSDSGAKRGYALARSEEAAASWAKTQAGRFALTLHNSGFLAQIRTCNGTGFTRSKRNGRTVCTISGSWDLP
ncbi:MAG: hypothetical protein AB1448_04850 [Pseudomonadota bacterium]